MNNNQINFKSKNIDNIRVHIIKDIAVFINEIYGHIPNMYIDTFGDSLSDELEAFCNLIIIDNENTFKEKADVFKKRTYSRILRKTITDINKNSLAFFGLVKKIGFDLNESKNLEELYAGITAIIYTDVFLGLFEALSVGFENRKIKELPKKNRIFIKLIKERIKNMITTYDIPIMRTMPEAYRMLKAADENTAITLHAIRNLVKKNIIKSFKVDSKILIDFNELIICISGGCNIA